MPETNSNNNNNILGMFTLDKTMKEAYSIDATIASSHKLHSASPRSSRSVHTTKKNKYG
jgi:hypothetical protein